MFELNESIEVKVLLLGDSGDPVAGTINYTVYDETDASFATGTMTAVSGETGLYTMSFTPDTAGEWTVVLDSTSPNRSASKIFYVGKGVEQTIDNNVDTLLTRLTATRATNLDELGATNVPADIDTLLTRLSAVRAGYLDELDFDLNARLGTPADTDISTDIANIYSRLGLPAYGSVANDIVDLKSYVNDLEVRLTNQRATNLDELGAANIPADIDTLLARLTAIRAGYLDELDFDLNARLGTPAGASIAADLVTITSDTNELQTDWVNGGRLDLLIDAILADTGELQTDWVNGGRLDLILDAILADTATLPADPADASDIAADFDRHLTFVDCWGDTDDLISITGASSDINLPDVIIPTLPTGATIWKVVLLFKCALIRDTSGSDNAINTASAAIRVKLSTGTWGVDDVVAYDIQDNMWAVDVSTSADRGGDAFVGNINNDDVSSEVTGAGTYNLRLEDILADGANLELHEVCVGLRVYFF